MMHGSLRQLSYRLATISLFAFVSSACGSASVPNASGSGSASTAPALHVELDRLGGGGWQISDNKGSAVLLYFFATFDNASQAGWAVLQRVAKRHPHVVIVGVAVQRQAAKMLPLYKDSLSIPFTLLYDRSERLMQGQTAFGQIHMIPSYWLWSADGRALGRLFGFRNEAELGALLETL